MGKLNGVQTGFKRLLQALLKRASLPQNACLEDIDYRTQRGLDKAEMLSLSTLDWIRNRNNLVMTGPTGTGKSWLACALANQACREGLSSHFIRFPAFLENLTAARATAGLHTRLQQLRKFDLLILDDWGIEPIPKRTQSDLLELIDSRSGVCSFIITSQMPMSLWHDMLENKTVADALMDRIVHSSYHIELAGESLRKSKNLSHKTSKRKTISQS